MPRTPLQQRLISIVEPVCEAAGYELVELRFVLEQGGWTLRVAIDLPLDQHTDPHEVPSDRVDLQDCEQLSRELSAVLDVEDPIPQAFSLEVSSPGIDRPLRTAAHYLHFAGSEAKIQLAMPIRMEQAGAPGATPGSSPATGPSPGPSAVERRNFKGILQGVIDGKVVIECDGATYQLPIDDIEHARLVPDWDAVMKGKSGVGKPAAKPIKPGHRPSQKRHRRDAGRDPGPGSRAGASTRPAAPSPLAAKPVTPATPIRAASSDGPSTREPQLRPGPAANDAENKEQG